MDALDKHISSIYRRIERDEELVECLATLRDLKETDAQLRQKIIQLEDQLVEQAKLLKKQKDGRKNEELLRSLVENKTISEEKLMALAEENTNTINDLRTQLEKAQERAGFIERLHSNQINTMQVLNEKNDQLTQENEQYKINFQLVKEHDLLAHALNKETEKANQMIRDEKHKVFELNRTNQELARRLVELEQAYAQLSVQNVQLIRENIELQSDLNKANESINMLKRDNADLEEKITSIRKLF